MTLRVQPLTSLLDTLALLSERLVQCRSDRRFEFSFKSYTKLLRPHSLTLYPSLTPFTPFAALFEQVNPPDTLEATGNVETVPAE